MSDKKIKKCPFCGGNGKVSVAQQKFIGKSLRGQVLCTFRVQVICNTCHSRGVPVITEPLLKGKGNQFDLRIKRHCRRAIEKWNKRVGEDL